jgi:hypothetical protein
MSSGLGSWQRAILAHLAARGGGDVVATMYEPQVRLARGVHDMRLVAGEMNEGGRGFSDPWKQAAFSRAVAGLIARGALRAYPTTVPSRTTGPRQNGRDG